MAASSYADQLAATKARIAAEVAARNTRTASNNQVQRDRSPIPLYGVGKGMDVYYGPGQTPGASRTEARGREISGYWDPRTRTYVPANWQRPQPGQVLHKDGSTYVGANMPEWMLPPGGGDPAREFREQKYGLTYPETRGSGSGGPPQVGPLPPRAPGGPPPAPPPAPGQGPMPIPPAGQGTPGFPYINMPPPNQPAPGGNKVPGSRPSWYHVQPDPFAAQLAAADVLRNG